MAYLSEIEAALFLGLKVETVQYLSKTCPKKGDDRTLKSVGLMAVRRTTRPSSKPTARFERAVAAPQAGRAADDPESDPRRRQGRVAPRLRDLRPHG